MGAASVSEKPWCIRMMPTGPAVDWLFLGSTTPLLPQLSNLPAYSADEGFHNTWASLLSLSLHTHIHTRTRTIMHKLVLLYQHFHFSWFQSPFVYFRNKLFKSFQLCIILNDAMKIQAVIVPESPPVHFIHTVCSTHLLGTRRCLTTAAALLVLK